MTESADDKLAVERCPQCARVLHDDYCSKCRRYVFVRKGTSVWGKFWRKRLHTGAFAGELETLTNKEERMRKYV